MTYESGNTTIGKKEGSFLCLATEGSIIHVRTCKAQRVSKYSTFKKKIEGSEKPSQIKV
jgi:hypothetical protein